MLWLFGCAHQLPLMSSPTIASVRRGAAPLAEARTTPCCRTKANASSAVAHVVMTPNDQANLRAAPTVDKLKGSPARPVKREVAKNNHAVSWKGFVIDASR